MSSLLRVLSREVDKILSPHGFHRQGKSWYRRTEETTVVFHLLKGRWANEYSGGIGVLFNAVDNISLPKIFECHWVGNLEADPLTLRGKPIVVSEHLAIADSTCGFPGQNEYIHALSNHGLSMMLEAGSTSGFAKLLESDRADALSIKGRARHLFDICRPKLPGAT